MCVAQLFGGGNAGQYISEREHQGLVPFERIYPDRDYVARMRKLAAENGYSIKEARAFCTDSVAIEYTHLDEIRFFDTDLIEMETSAFYAIAEIMDIPAVAPLVVSDNSATGIPLVGRSEEIQRKYEHSRCQVLPDMIYRIAKMKV